MPQDLVLESLRGGLNDTDPPNALRPDECTIAENVEWFHSTLGERRLGADAVDVTGLSLTGSEIIVLAARHFPTANILDNELWVFIADPGVSVRVGRNPGSGWTIITPAVSISPDTPYVYQMSALSFNGNLYIAAKLVGGADRMLIWDGSTLRLAGLAAPAAAPTVADEGAGTFTGTRYYRVRNAQLSGSEIIRMSEPSAETTFVPSGAGAGARITKPAGVGEGETHWIVEASSDGSTFYQIATVPVATTTYDDTTDLAITSYASIGTLSPDIGEYIPLPAAQYLCVDDDRLCVGASFVDDANDSQVAWTPTRNATGYGNDERIPANTDNSLQLNPKEGGGLTGLGQTTNGMWYAFKSSQIYQLTRTGLAANAYNALGITKAIGAMPGSLVSGMDEYGRPTLYFCDPQMGPQRISGSGPQQILGIRGTWGRVNASATKVQICGCYYPYKKQVWWMVAVDGADSPNLGIKIQVSELRSNETTARGGISLVTGAITEAYTMTQFAELFVDSHTGIQTLSIRPIMGYASPHFLLRGDVGDTDNNISYYARMRTRPMFQAGLLNRWGAMAAALLAQANGSAKVQVSFIRNYGRETNAIVSTLEPVGTEPYVVRVFDNLVMSSAVGIQVEFADVTDLTRVPGVLYHEENP